MFFSRFSVGWVWLGGHVSGKLWPMIGAVERNMFYTVLSTVGVSFLIPHFNMAGLEALWAAGAWRTMVPRIQQALLLSAAYSLRRLGRRPACEWRPKMA